MNGRYGPDDENINSLRAYGAPGTAPSEFLELGIRTPKDFAHISRVGAWGSGITYKHACRLKR